MNNIYIVFLISLLSLTTNAQDVNFEWANSIGGTSNDFFRSMTNDASGNILITGEYLGTIDFDPGPDIFNLTSNGVRDGFIQKLDTDGNFLWAKSFGGIAFEQNHSITTDDSGNVYVTGYFQDTVDFDPGEATFNLISNGGEEIFILKLDIDGDFIWAKSIGVGTTEVGRSITIDNSGNIYVAGTYRIGPTDFDPGPDIFNLTSNGARDVFILKLNADGNFIWAKSVGGPFDDDCSFIATDSLGDVYINGVFQNVADFDPGAAAFNLTSNGSFDIFILKLDDSGDFIWANSMGGADLDFSPSFTLYASEDIYVTGYYKNTVDFDPGETVFNLTSNGGRDAFIQKLNTNGDFVWAKSFGGIEEDLGRSISFDSSGNLYVIGSFQNTVDFDPGVEIFNLSSNGSYDIFIQKLDENGGLIWAKSMGGTETDIGISTTIDASNSIILSGTFNGTVDVDPTDSSFELTSNGSGDIFIEKLSQCSSMGIDVVTACDSYTWIDGIDYTESNNSTTFVLTNNAGCDSVVSLNLTINYSNVGTDVITACDSYTWIDGVDYTENNNSATFILTNIAGCDSLVTLDLTINTVDVGVTVTDPIITANAVGAVYQWLDCNNNNSIIDGETGKSFTATTNGSYAVVVTENGCADTSICVTITTVGIIENAITNQVSIYPNPNQGLVNIEFGNLKEVSIKVFNVSGQLIYHKEDINTSTHQFKLNEAPGVYVLEVNAHGEKQQYKLMKK